MSGQTPPNLDLLYEIVKARVADQSAQIGTLDTKANFGVASSTLLITSVAGLCYAFAAAQQARAVGDLVLPGWAGRWRYFSSWSCAPTRPANSAAIPPCRGWRCCSTTIGIGR